MTKKAMLSGNLFAAALGITFSALAEPQPLDDLTAASPPSGLAVVFRPYGWLTWLDGDITVRGRTADVDITPEDVIESLKMAWFSYAEARVGRIAIFNDIAYANLGASGDLARVRDNAAVDVSAGLDVKQATIELGGAYVIGFWESGGGFKDFSPPCARPPSRSWVACATGIRRPT
jgi:hypothetical protein